MVDILEKYDVLGAFWMTIQLTFFAAIGSLVLGTVLAVMRVAPVAVLRGLGAFYVNTVRNTPLTLILVFCVLGLLYVLQVPSPPPTRRPRCGTTRSAGRSSGSSVYHAAFVCEALRSGVNTVDSGQAEAARSIGLTFAQSMREVILPQAFRGAIAPLGSVLIALTKNTTVASIIGVAEASGLMKTDHRERDRQRRRVPRLRHRVRHPHPAGRAPLHEPVPTPGGEAMSAPSLLFDAPGPQARARHRDPHPRRVPARPRRCWPPCCGSSDQSGQLEGEMWSRFVGEQRRVDAVPRARPRATPSRRRRSRSCSR